MTKTTQRIAGLMLLMGIHLSTAQADSIPKNILGQVILESTRIDMPMSEDFRTIDVITSQTLQQWNITSTSQALERISGIDLRQRGPFGVQADLYIRGGGFEQTLLLIDGVKLDDPQTGHHTLNFLIPIETIERIEIIKGPAGRIYGQNAYTGAVNIVTKKEIEKSTRLQVELGSYHQGKLALGLEREFNDKALMLFGEIHRSDGYRYNTDFDIQNYFMKTQLGQSNNVPIHVLSMYSGRKFGANGFYATPTAINQYEETQASLVAVHSTVSIENWVLKPRLFWRRHQDLYLFVRNNPEVYRNLHISNKVGASFDSSVESKWGIIGAGVHLTNTTLSSNNLGDRNRTEASLFLDHQISLFNSALDMTWGFAYSHYSDFGDFFYPGLDVGIRLNRNARFYGNVGYTYRIPTYTDLYYSDPTTLGNNQLKTEEALSQEIGFKYNTTDIHLLLAFFNRKSQNLIDYIKEKEIDLWMANNIREVDTWGIEAESKIYFSLNNHQSEFHIGYTYLEDQLKDVSSRFSRYRINSLKHQVTVNIIARMSHKISVNPSIRYGKRSQQEGYLVVDLGAQLNMSKFRFGISAFNLFNEKYTLTNLIPMPKGSGLISVEYVF
ncbi:MAG: TonB-dependent receptor [Flavobacteriaceae bacterium]|nr:TonB-dependent receptor [Flavobacteriaceae bacterium]